MRPFVPDFCEEREKTDDDYHLNLKQNKIMTRP